MVKELDRGTLHDRLCELEDRHIRPPPRPVDRKKPQSGCRQAIKKDVGMSHEFVGLFSRGIQADRMIDGVPYRKRQFGVGAIYRGRRRIEQMTAFMMPTPLQHIEEALEIGI